MSLTLREATERDLPGLLVLYRQLGQDDGSVLPLEEAQRVLARFRDYPYYRLHVAELEGELVGTFALLFMDNLGHRGAPSAVLEDVVVAQELRGQGIGKEMMAYANEICRQRGCYKMTFSSNLNREPAHRFYESLGYRKHGFSFFIDYQ